MSADDNPKKNEEPQHPYETDESFHPLGKEWEGDMRDKLEETEFDADLGMQMAKDAQRLVAGEITEEEFYAEYHDDIQDEFDVDERPVFDDVDDVDIEDIEDESMLESLKDVDITNEDMSRREMMKKMGAGAAFLGYGAYATADDDEAIPEDVSGIRPADKEDREHRWGMVIDLERCDGCLSCVAGCINENGTSTGANWMYVFAYEDGDTGQENFLVRPCQHCSNAPCAKVCPVRARHARSKDGIVLTDYEICIGCRYCQVACPYGVNYFQWGEPDVPMGELPHADITPDELQAMDEDDRDDFLEEENDHVYDERGRWVDSRPPQGVMGKCTFCPTRQDGHSDRPKGTTACEDACHEAGMSAIHFGDMDAESGDEFDRPVSYLERRTEVEESPAEKAAGFDDLQEGEAADYEQPPAPHPVSQLPTFHLLEDLGTEPNITYIGNEPGPKAEQKDEGPVPYESIQNDWGVEVVDKRKEHLDAGAQANREGEQEEEGEA
jgi:molybdopterin-containing oxidoreductase family iron-sulfur binding subunit